MRQVEQRAADLASGPHPCDPTWDAFAAIAIMATGVNLVLYSGTTGGPFELLMLAGEDRGIKQLHVRYALDGGVFILGLALGGTFGVATVIYAVLMGVVLQGIRQVFADYDTGRRFRLSAA